MRAVTDFAQCKDRIRIIYPASSDLKERKDLRIKQTYFEVLCPQIIRVVELTEVVRVQRKDVPTVESKFAQR